MPAPPIAVVGMACRYPDAVSPEELWENALARRQAFRRIPPERLSEADYFSSDPDRPDTTYCFQAALLCNYEFDRVRFRVAGNTFRSADLTHWLALEVASEALERAGLPAGGAREGAGVFLGNSLTGEFSRAGLLRLRWPYVRRVVEQELRNRAWESPDSEEFLASLEASYKQPFAETTEESLAGALSNTIAGRIANHFDFHGGAYTVDGACASSLLAVCTACSALAAGDVDFALAGGVDLSLDPLEIVGFAKTRALAATEMRVYDRDSAGFWPGEGCGFAALMRYEDAAAERRPIHAVIRGWGISSDGHGGVTRPEVAGQMLALARAYRKAGFGIETVPYFEGHGTGTAVGDTTELRALTRARRERSPGSPAAVISSVKTNIGHTKAAAGLAGLLKTAMAIQKKVLPPTAGIVTPHPELTGDSPALRVLARGEPWPESQPLRAGVSAMGFGGINTHVVLEAPRHTPCRAVSPRELKLLASWQDAELFLLSDPGQLEQLSPIAGRLSRAELTDAAAGLAREAKSSGWKAAVIASTPEELAARLEELSARLPLAKAPVLDAASGIFFSTQPGSARVGFLFPGQGSPVRAAGVFESRFEARIRPALRVAPGVDFHRTESAQPAIVACSLAALRVLADLGLRAEAAVGHSLGEWTALCWAGAFSEDEVLALVRRRGEIMAEVPEPHGAMASLAAPESVIHALIRDPRLTIAAINGPSQTVVAGEQGALEAFCREALSRGIRSTRLPVSHGFHSPCMIPAEAPLARCLAQAPQRPPAGAVFSTVTGCRLPEDAVPAPLLVRQLTSPVRFTEALRSASEQVDLWIEVGPGTVLTDLARNQTHVPAFALDSASPSVRGLLTAFAAAFVTGVPVDPRALFADRLTKPFSGLPRFLENPCERAPASRLGASLAPSPPQPAAAGPGNRGETPLDLLRLLVAQRAELPLSAVKPDSRLLSDLHLNSIAVAELVVETARRCGFPPPAAPTEFADASITAVIEALESPGRDRPAERYPAGAGPWFRRYTTHWRVRPLASRPPALPHEPGRWQIFSPRGHAVAAALEPRQAELPSQGGVVLCLPASPREDSILLLLQAAQAAARNPAPAHFALVGHGPGAASLARTLFLETPGLTVTVLDVPAGDGRACGWIVEELQAASGFTEVRYDSAGQRSQPVFAPAAGRNEEAVRLGPQDVLLVSGGGKGIAAECALSLAQRYGVRLVILGRSRPEADPELRENLRRFEQAGIPFVYRPADVADIDSVRQAVRTCEAELGAVTAVLHGAGANVPRLIPALDEAAFRATVAPKVSGFRHLMAALDPGKLRLVTAFGSIIARTGLPGEADYAVANEWLAQEVDRWAAAHPRIRCATVEWSIWSGTGMGQRLGRVDALLRQGITPIPIDEGVRQFENLLESGAPATSVVVTGRFGSPPTLELESRALPFLRFLERPLLHYPGVELVVEAGLSSETDPYLDDHIFDGTRLLPAVMGLEAMAQVASALTGCLAPIWFEEVSFDKPVSVSDHGPVAIRIAAVARPTGEVDVALRSAATGFQTDHFRAVCRFDIPPAGVLPNPLPVGEAPLLDAAGLYGGLLFQGSRFQRVQSYTVLEAFQCQVRLEPGGPDSWFARYLPSDLVLGDPGLRDSAIHALQAAIPHAVVLPAAVRQILPLRPAAPGPRILEARERERQGPRLVWDLIVRDQAGEPVEAWFGLVLHITKPMAVTAALPAPLLGPYLERRLRELIPEATVSACAEAGPAPRHRIDGKPLAGTNISRSHSGPLTLRCTSPEPVGCDVEPVRARDHSTWLGLLGPGPYRLAQHIATESREAFDAAATRVWCALESAKKAGVAPDAAFFYESDAPDGWVILRGGAGHAATWVASLPGGPPATAFAIFASQAHASVRIPAYR